MTSNPTEIDDLVQANDGLPRYFRIDTTGARKSTDDLMKIALNDPVAKALIIKLTQLGFSLYYNDDNESRFIRQDRIRHHWPAIKDGSYLITDDDIVYTIEQPASERVDKIVVIFSPINSKPRLSRYFWPSFSKLMKFLPPNTAVLRIADVGGVKGAFYMDTVAQPHNADAVHNLIETTIAEHSLENSDVVLYGASKGGTGAAFHGLRGGWSFVAEYLKRWGPPDRAIGDHRYCLWVPAVASFGATTPQFDAHDPFAHHALAPVGAHRAGEHQLAHLINSNRLVKVPGDASCICGQCRHADATTRERSDDSAVTVSTLSR